MNVLVSRYIPLHDTEARNCCISSDQSNFLLNFTTVDDTNFKIHNI